MNRTLTIISLHFLLLVLCATNPTVTSTELEKVQDFSPDLCGLVNCLQGNCVHSNESLIGVDCQCFPGWQKLPLFPICVLPNCTLDQHGCGGKSAPPPLPPPPPLLPINFSDPCYLVWCGDGNCVANQTGHGHSCQCNDGSANMFGDTSFACLRQCYLGADCQDVGLGHPSPPCIDSGSSGNGMASASGSIGNDPRFKHQIRTTLLLSVSVLVALFLLLSCVRVCLKMSTFFKTSTLLTMIVSAALHFTSQC